MSTINQRKNSTWKSQTNWKRPKFNGSPQRKGIVLRLRICTPRKPNSARRPVVKVMLSSQKKALSHIPGAGHTLKRHSRTLIKGVGARDLPVVNYTCIRGVYDFEPLYKKRRRRSIYGVKLASDLKTHIKRSIRNLI
jgi:ribosomal protein S12